MKKYPSVAGYPSLPHSREFNMSVWPVISTQRSLLFSPPPLPEICHFHKNLSIPLKPVNYIQIWQFNTNPLVLHESFCSTQIYHFHANSSVPFLSAPFWCGSDLYCWRIWVELTDLCLTDVWKWRICVELPICVWKWEVFSVSYLYNFFSNWTWRAKLFTIASMTGCQSQTAWDTL